MRRITHLSEMPSPRALSGFLRLIRNSIEIKLMKREDKMKRNSFIKGILLLILRGRSTAIRLGRVL